jgi:hypothetical protein
VPRLCKPTKEAIISRAEAYYRHSQITGHEYQIHYPIPVSVFGLDDKNLFKTGELTMKDLIYELSVANKTVLLPSKHPSVD